MLKIIFIGFPHSPKSFWLIIINYHTQNKNLTATWFLINILYYRYNVNNHIIIQILHYYIGTYKKKCIYYFLNFTLLISYFTKKSLYSSVQSVFRIPPVKCPLTLTGHSKNVLYSEILLIVIGTNCFVFSIFNPHLTTLFQIKVSCIPAQLCLTEKCWNNNVLTNINIIQ